MITTSFLLLLLLLSPVLSVPDDWNHGCIESYNENGNMSFVVPQQAETGDLLMLFLSRTDDYLPLKLENWKYGGSCFKTGNGQKRCFTRNDCKKLKDGYCFQFPRGRGKDLATVVFFKSYEYESQIDIDFYGTQPGWGFLLAVKGVNTTRPIRNRSVTSADNSTVSVFPSVSGRQGDLLLLSMAFDDKTDQENFMPPNGTSFVNFVRGSDEAGYLYSKTLDGDGATGTLRSIGAGGSSNKDALISLVLKGAENNEVAVTADNEIPSPTSMPSKNNNEEKTTELPTISPTSYHMSNIPTSMSVDVSPEIIFIGDTLADDNDNYDDDNDIIQLIFNDEPEGNLIGADIFSSSPTFSVCTVYLTTTFTLIILTSYHAF